MLNLDRLGALDFQKGCYPGQEIIARTQHLGSVRRRATTFIVRDPSRLESLTTAGDELVQTAALVDTPLVDARGERIGEVLRAAYDVDGSMVLLAVVALAALHDSVFVNSPTGTALDHIDPAFESLE